MHFYSTDPHLLLSDMCPPLHARCDAHIYHMPSLPSLCHSRLSLPPLRKRSMPSRPLFQRPMHIPHVLCGQSRPTPSPDSHTIQGYLAHKKPSPPRTLR
ncbi:hypothetical protein T484DRAFT_1923439 [Baffinella frigidus]|nr:hypothetical protein T484DRAFT_1923439 [Cryptophyta sp. CCMP2293]